MFIRMDPPDQRYTPHEQRFEVLLVLREACVSSESPFTCISDRSRTSWSGLRSVFAARRSHV